MALPHKPESFTWSCDMKGCGATLQREEGAECHVCDRTICDGCTYDCAECGHAFCIDHIIDTAVALHTSLYHCTTCFAAQEVAA
jgi:hypothetical protein